MGNCARRSRVLVYVSGPGWLVAQATGSDINNTGKSRSDKIDNFAFVERERERKVGSSGCSIETGLAT